MDWKAASIWRPWRLLVWGWLLLGSWVAHAQALPCAAPDPERITTFPSCSEGGGIFGQWRTDEHGLPAFDYTFDQLNDPRGAWPNSEDIFPLLRERRDHFIVMGNRRTNFMAVDDGYVVLLSGERGPTWLNRFSESQRNLAGGFSYVKDGAGTWCSAYRYAPASATTRKRLFGLGYYETVTEVNGLRVRHVLHAPAGDEPLLLDEVELTNTSTISRTFSHYEYWDVNRHQLLTEWVRTGLGAGPSDSSRDNLNGRFLQQTTSTSLSGIPVLLASLRPKPGETVPAREVVSAMDWYPPDVFLAALDAPVNGVHTHQDAFFGAGTPAAPEAVSSGTPGGLLGPVEGFGQPAMLAFRSDLTLAPGETRRLRFVYGYLPQGASLDMLLRYTPAANPTPLASSLAQWRERLAYAAIPGSQLMHRETAWRSAQLLGNGLFSEYYNTLYTPQGSAYLYLHGADGAPRDQALFAAATTWLDPEVARGNLRLILSLQNAVTGQITYAFTGHGVHEGATLHNNPSDLDLFLLLALSEYLAATGDRAFLSETVPFYPRGAGRPAWVSGDTVLDHARVAFRHLVERVGRGPNGLIRLWDGDWSDGIVYEDPSPTAISFTISQGESVPNSQMALVVLRLAASHLEAADPGLASQMRGYADSLVGPVRKTFGGRWFGRAWLRNSLNMAYLKGNDWSFDWFNATYIDLEAQPWGLLAEVLDPTQRERVLNEVESRLDADSPMGPRMRPGGMVWPAISQLMTWAYARYRPASAWRSLEEHLSTTHARVWPAQWIGLWSGPDGFNSAGTDGGTWTSPVTPMSDFPVANMNPDAMWVLGLLRTAGVEPAGNGLNLTPRGGGKDTYVVQTPLLRLEVSPNRVGGTYRAYNSGSTWLNVAVPAGRTPIVRVGGTGVPVAVSEGRARVPLSFQRGQSIPFEVTW